MSMRPDLKPGDVVWCVVETGDADPSLVSRKVTAVTAKTYSLVHGIPFAATTSRAQGRPLDEVGRSVHLTPQAALAHYREDKRRELRAAHRRAAEALRLSDWAESELEKIA